MVHSQWVRLQATVSAPEGGQQSVVKGADAPEGNTPGCLVPESDSLGTSSDVSPLSGRLMKLGFLLGSLKPAPNQSWQPFIYNNTYLLYASLVNPGDAPWNKQKWWVFFGHLRVWWKTGEEQINGYIKLQTVLSALQKTTPPGNSPFTGQPDWTHLKEVSLNVPQVALMATSTHSSCFYPFKQQRP